MSFIATSMFAVHIVYGTLIVVTWQAKSGTVCLIYRYTPKALHHLNITKQFQDHY